MSVEKPTCAGLFAGIGGFCFGFEKDVKELSVKGDKKV